MSLALRQKRYGLTLRHLFPHGDAPDDWLEPKQVVTRRHILSVNRGGSSANDVTDTVP